MKIKKILNDKIFTQFILGGFGRIVSSILQAATVVLAINILDIEEYAQLIFIVTFSSLITGLANAWASCAQNIYTSNAGKSETRETSYIVVVGVGIFSFLLSIAFAVFFIHFTGFFEITNILNQTSVEEDFLIIVSTVFLSLQNAQTVILSTAGQTRQLASSQNFSKALVFCVCLIYFIAQIKVSAVHYYITTSVLSSLPSLITCMTHCESCTAKRAKQMFYANLASLKFFPGINLCANIIRIVEFEVIKRYAGNEYVAIIGFAQRILTPLVNGVAAGCRNLWPTLLLAQLNEKLIVLRKIIKLQMGLLLLCIILSPLVYLISPIVELLTPFRFKMLDWVGFYLLAYFFCSTCQSFAFNIFAAQKMLPITLALLVFQLIFILILIWLIQVFRLGLILFIGLYYLINGIVVCAVETIMIKSILFDKQFNNTTF